MTKLKSKVKEQIIAALNEVQYGATITEIEKKVKYERHTVSKYLTELKAEGIVNLKIAGKAKFWFINKAPLKSITKTPSSSRSYIENVLLNLLSNFPAGILVIDRDYNIQYANDYIKTKYGDVEDQKFYKEILGLENALKLKKIENILDYATITKANVTIEDKTGNILKIQASKLENPDSSPCAILMIEDITQDIKDAEQMKKLSTVVEQTADMVMITDKEGMIEYINPAFEKETGYTASEIIGKKPNILKSGKHTKKFYKTMWDTILNGKPYYGLVIDKKKNNGLLYEQKTITPLFENKKITHFVSTGKVLAEEGIRPKQKMRVAKRVEK